MDRYVLFKRYLNEFHFKRFDSIEELEKHHQHSEEFKGEFVAIYDLREEMYLSFPEFHGLGSYIDTLLNKIKNP